MRNRISHNFAVACLAALLLFPAGNASAVSLEKIEVASHLDEPFFAEIPLALAANELASRVFVEIAAPADYKIFEVYRDPVLNVIRADIASDERGARVELTSGSSIKAPFFNLVLKVRYGRVTHFKKYPVFLELARPAQAPEVEEPVAQADPVRQAVPVEPAAPVRQAAPQPAATPVEKAKTEQIVAPTSSTKTKTEKPVEKASAPVTADARPTAEFKPFDGWARIGRYGPMVRGDTVSTVALRLRIDNRYSLNQVTAALFEKNRSKFEMDNVNLVQAGTFLDVPAAKEVESIERRQANRLIAEHEKRWRELTKQPRYAAVEIAQKTRYSGRVRIGDKADGIASAPASVPPAAEEAVKTEDKPAAVAEPEARAVATEDASDAARAAEDRVKANQQMTKAYEEALAGLKKKNTELVARLNESEKKIEGLTRKLSQQSEGGAEAAAARARMERLEIQLARLQGELEKARKQPSSVKPERDWLIWLLTGLIVVLIAIAGFLMRREPAHPAESSEKEAGGAAGAESEALLAKAARDNAQAPDADDQDTPGHVATEQEINEFIDTISDMSDALTDSDTAEMEPFDATTLGDPDPNVDYLSEADVYIRYGMDDEALQQLDMALALQSNHVDAHVKKVIILRGKDDARATGEAIDAAHSALSGADLDRFNEAVKEQAAVDFSTDEKALEDALSTSDISELTGAFREQGFADDDDEDDESAAPESTPDDNSDAFDVDAMLAELDDLDLEDAPAPEPADTPPPELETREIPTDADEMDSVLNEMDDFQTAPAADELRLPDEAGSPTADDSDQSGSDTRSFETIDLNSVGTMDWLQDSDLDFDETREHSLDTETTELEFDASDATAGIDDENDPGMQTIEGQGATQELTSLFKAYSDQDEQLSLDADEPDAPIVEQVENAGEDQAQRTNETDTLDLDAVHGATQELDHLLKAYSDDESPQVSLDNVDFGSDEADSGDSEKAKNRLPDDASIEEVPGATQQLDHLLSEFSDDELQFGIDDAEPEDAAGDASDFMNDASIDHNATQELDNLLSEFSDDDEDEDKGKV